jgi:hypothetical protein
MSNSNLVVTELKGGTLTLFGSIITCFELYNIKTTFFTDFTITLPSASIDTNIHNYLTSFDAPLYGISYSS